MVIFARPMPANTAVLVLIQVPGKGLGLVLPGPEYALTFGGHLN